MPQRIEKVVVPILLSSIDHPPSVQDDAVFGGPGTNCDDARRRRPDLLWLGSDRIVSVEIDEHSHVDRTSVCETGKMHDQFVSWQQLLGHVPVFYLRLNPDEFDGAYTLLEDRVRAVANRVNHLLSMDLTDHLTDLAKYSALAPHVEYFYYHSKAQHHIEAVRGASDSFVFIGSEV